MSDSGGQPNFLDVFPLFVRNKCLALFTLKLNEQLDAIPQFSYCIQGHSISMADTRLQHSHWQLLESLAKSMSSFLPSLSPSSDCHGNARFAVIGTFADRMHECESESLDDKNTSLAQSLKAYEPVRIDFKDKQPIFPLNAVIEDKKQRRQYMMELRRLISKSPSIKVTIKLRWFGFYLSLLSKAEQRAILPLQECLDIGSSLDMDEQETGEAIKFFHNLNLILSYQSLVIMKLKPIHDLVSLLIGVNFINGDALHNRFRIVLPPGARKHFHQHGCFDRQILAECFQFPRLLNAEAFINLLAEVKAVAIIEKSNEFFMPCVLRYASKEQEREIMLCSDLEHKCPWIVRLNSQVGSQELYIPLPPAFSPTLIVLLLSSHLFSVVNGQQQYRNIFVLHYKKGGDVTIFERQLHLAIYYSFRDSDCSSIRSVIHKAILETEERLSFDVKSITIEDSFPCSCNPQRECHHILLTGLPARARCELNRNKMCELREQELRWLQSPAGMPLLWTISLLLCCTIGTNTTTQLSTAAAGVSGDHSRTLSELHYFNEKCLFYVLIFS